MSEQVRDLYQKIREITNEIDQLRTRTDKDQQGVIDRINDLSAKQDSIRANVTHIASKIQTITDRIEKVEGEIGIKKGPPADEVKQIIIAGI